MNASTASTSVKSKKGGHRPPPAAHPPKAKKARREPKPGPASSEAEAAAAIKALSKDAALSLSKAPSGKPPSKDKAPSKASEAAAASKTKPSKKPRSGGDPSDQPLATTAKKKPSKAKRPAKKKEAAGTSKPSSKPSKPSSSKRAKAKPKAKGAGAAPGAIAGAGSGSGSGSCLSATAGPPGALRTAASTSTAAATTATTATATTYEGVTYEPRTRQYRALLRRSDDGRTFDLGLYELACDAALARDAAHRIAGRERGGGGGGIGNDLGEVVRALNWLDGHGDAADERQEEKEGGVNFASPARFREARQRELDGRLLAGKATGRVPSEEDAKTRIKREMLGLAKAYKKKKWVPPELEEGEEPATTTTASSTLNPYLNDDGRLEEESSRAEEAEALLSLKRKRRADSETRKGALAQKLEALMTGGGGGGENMRPQTRPRALDEGVPTGASGATATPWSHPLDDTSKGSVATTVESASSATLGSSIGGTTMSGQGKHGVASVEDPNSATPAYFNQSNTTPTAVVSGSETSHQPAGVRGDAIETSEKLLLVLAAQRPDVVSEHVMLQLLREQRERAASEAQIRAHLLAGAGGVGAGVGALGGAPGAGSPAGPQGLGQQEQQQQQKQQTQAPNGARPSPTQPPAVGGAHRSPFWGPRSPALVASQSALGAQLKPQPVEAEETKPAERPAPGPAAGLASLPPDLARHVSAPRPAAGLASLPPELARHVSASLDASLRARRPLVGPGAGATMPAAFGSSVEGEDLEEEEEVEDPRAVLQRQLANEAKKAALAQKLSALMGGGGGGGSGGGGPRRDDPPREAARIGRKGEAKAEEPSPRAGPADAWTCTTTSSTKPPDLKCAETGTVQHPKDLEGNTSQNVASAALLWQQQMQALQSSQSSLGGSVAGGVDEQAMIQMLMMKKQMDEKNKQVLEQKVQDYIQGKGVPQPGAAPSMNPEQSSNLAFRSMQQEDNAPGMPRSDLVRQTAIEALLAQQMAAGTNQAHSAIASDALTHEMVQQRILMEENRLRQLREALQSQVVSQSHLAQMGGGLGLGNNNINTNPHRELLLERERAAAVNAEYQNAMMAAEIEASILRQALALRASSAGAGVSSSSRDSTAGIPQEVLLAAANYGLDPQTLRQVAHWPR
ncbi:hypothetical protein ACHAWF_009136 [Thalassiosira exigua]